MTYFNVNNHLCEPLLILKNIFNHQSYLHEKNILKLKKKNLFLCFQPNSNNEFRKSKLCCCYISWTVKRMKYTDIK